MALNSKSISKIFFYHDFPHLCHFPTFEVIYHEPKIPIYKKFLHFQSLHWIWECWMWHIAKSIWNGSLDFTVVWINTFDCNTIPISCLLQVTPQKSTGMSTQPMPNPQSSGIWTPVWSTRSMSCLSTTWESPISPLNLSLSQLQVRIFIHFWINVHF